MKSPKAIAKKILGWLLPLALTVALLWYLFSKVDFADMMDIIASGCDWWWILLAMALSVGSHILRAMRWRLQLTPAGIRPTFASLCCSIFGTYALNLIFPRLGEFWRSSYIARTTRSSFTTVLGTVVADRLFDSMAVFIIGIITLILARPALISFLDRYSIGQGLIDLLANPLFWSALAACAFILFLLLRLLGNTKPVKKIKEWTIQTWRGFTSIAKMPGKGRFLLLTAAIWLCYFIQLYVAFFAFDFTRQLCADPRLGFGLIPCLVAFLFGAIGMAIPSNGGLGPWNIAVIFGLALYGVSQDQGAAFSMVQWSGQTVMLIILGIFTIAYIAANTKAKKQGRATARP